MQEDPNEDEKAEAGLSDEAKQAKVCSLVKN